MQYCDLHVKMIVYIYVFFLFLIDVTAGLSPYEFDEDQASPTGEMSKDNTHSLQPSSKPTSTQLHQKYVSYDEYLTFWKGIATSVTDYKQINQCRWRTCGSYGTVREGTWCELGRGRGVS